MAIEDLKKSLLDMSPDEKLALLQEIRSDRRVSKTAVTQRAAKKKTKADGIEKKFNELSAEDQEALIRMLQGE